MDNHVVFMNIYNRLSFNNRLRYRIADPNNPVLLAQASKRSPVKFPCPICQLEQLIPYVNTFSYHSNDLSFYIGLANFIPPENTTSYFPKYRHYLKFTNCVLQIMFYIMFYSDLFLVGFLIEYRKS